MNAIDSALTSVDLSRRDVRQRDLVPPAKLCAWQALVIGVGAIGRQVSLQLAAMGMTRMILFDHDHVEVENLAPQGYMPEDLGRAKVEATAAACQRLNPELDLQLRPNRFARSSLKTVDGLENASDFAVFCCVDSITTRSLVWETVRQRAGLFVDGRMSAEVVRVLAIPRPGSDGYYASTLFEPHQAQGGACTARSTIYSASVAAGLMLCQFTRWLRDLPVDRDLSVNLLTSELSVA